jgi:hypothetical protein
MQDEPYRLSPDPAPEPAPADHDRPLIFQLRSTQSDEELRAIEWILTLLEPLPYDAQVRTLAYIQDRVTSDQVDKALAGTGA